LGSALVALVFQVGGQVGQCFAVLRVKIDGLAVVATGLVTVLLHIAKQTQPIESMSAGAFSLQMLFAEATRLLTVPSVGQLGNAVPE
jgi:butyrate kinase